MQLYKTQIVYGGTVLISEGLYCSALKTFIINFMKQKQKEINYFITGRRQT